MTRTRSSTVISALLLAPALATAQPAAAASPLAIHGLFCKTQQQIEDAFAHLRRNIPVERAVALVNTSDVRCVWANRLSYVIADPVAAGGFRHAGAWLTIYEADLVGVLVGDHPRPVDPPVRMYFVPNDALPEAAAASRT